jgi:3',5'-cyclic AMP phosphodiesterase CpdA
VDLIGKRITGYINWQRKRRLVHDPEILARIVDDMRQQAADHIAVTGDLANLALPKEVSRGREWLNTLGPAADVSVVPGNHDMYVAEAMPWIASQWRAFMGDEQGPAVFPYVRRRGDVALIGVCSGVPTAPFLATGWIGADQLAALRQILSDLGREGLFRVVMIHHPPMTDAPNHKRLLDANVLLRMIGEHGAELVLHGHDHIHALVQIKGPNGPVPSVGIPSASAAPGGHWTPAAYNLYRIGGEPGRWRCEAISRGVGDGGRVEELGRVTLAEA